MKKLLFFLLLTVCLSAQPSSEAEVRGLLSDFLTAFNNLDWQPFRKCWTDKPVVFYPSLVPNATGRRTDELAGFESAWRRQFDVIREAAVKRGQTQAPFQNIEPKDVRIDFPSDTVAVVTFHLGPNNNVLGRRMLVVVKTAAGWKISHLHASNLPLPTQ